jgi:hypothetical protein
LAYLLQKASEKDQVKIFEDIKGEPKKHQRLLFNKKFIFNDFTWAIDFERDLYLYAIEQYAQRGRLFNFYYKGKTYEIEVKEGLFRSRSLVQFCDKEKLDQPLLFDLQQEIKEALKIYGIFGQGVDGDMFTVNAVFET